MVRFYTFNFPIDKGKGRVFKLAKRFCRKFPRDVVVPTRDGRKLRVSFRDWADDLIYFLGTYESFCTEIICKYIKKDRVYLDVGANIGWYTTLFQTHCGEKGEVHAFEPVPTTFAELEQNVDLNNNRSRVTLNNFGLGDEECEMDIHVFPEFPGGHASLAANANHRAINIPIKIKTVNRYLSEKQINHVDFVKVDIEGAELMFLKGATRLFEQKTPPVMLMEMSPETSEALDHKPDDLITFIRSRADYDFFALDEKRRRLIPLKVFEDGSEGANVLCVPRT